MGLENSFTTDKVIPTDLRKLRGKSRMPVSI